MTAKSLFLAACCKHYSYNKYFQTLWKTAYVRNRDKQVDKLNVKF